jgi:hypothetical protein
MKWPIECVDEKDILTGYGGRHDENNSQTSGTFTLFAIPCIVMANIHDPLFFAGADENG